MGLIERASSGKPHLPLEKFHTEFGLPVVLDPAKIVARFSVIKRKGGEW
jgi:hypothetical protein